MKQCKCLLFVVCFSALMLLAGSVFAFEILLDIDVDNDPTTINTFTEEPNAVVKIVLRPTVPGEVIADRVEFMLGGPCFDRDNCPLTYYFYYGVMFDYWFEMGDWVTAPGFDGGTATATCMDCCSNPGAHVLMWFYPEGDGAVVLNEPIFLDEFNAWVVAPPEGCPPAATALTVFREGQDLNFVSLVEPYVITGTESSTWGQVKSIYR